MSVCAAPGSPLSPQRGSFSPEQSTSFSFELIAKEDSSTKLMARLKVNPSELEALDDDNKSLLIRLISAGAYNSAFIVLRDTEFSSINQPDRDGLTALHYLISAYKGINKEKIQELNKLFNILIGKGASVTVRDLRGWTPLHFVAYFELEDLLMEYVTPTTMSRPHDEVFKDGTTTPTHLAAVSPSLCLDIFLQIHEDVDIKDSQQSTPLHIAVTAPTKTAIKNCAAILAKTKNPNHLNADGETALSLACLNDCELIARAIMEFRFRDDVHVNLNLGHTPPLVGAYINGNTSLFDDLLNAGASPDAKWGDDYLLDIATAKGDHETVKKLVDRKATLTPQHLAITKFRNPRRAISFSFLTGRNVGGFSKDALTKQQHLSPVPKDPEGNSGLHHIASLPDFDVEMIQKYTSLEKWNSTRNAKGETPFLFVCRKGNLIQVLVLLSIGVNATLQDGEGNSALHLALLCNNRLLFYFLATTFKELLRTRNTKGETPLQMAVRLGLRYAVEILIKLKVDVKVEDVSKNTLLHSLAFIPKERQLDMRPIVALLAREKLNLEAQNNQKRTPLVLAWERQQQFLFTRLLELGAKPNAELSDGHTLLMSVAADGNLKSAEQLVLSGADRNAKGVTTPLIEACKGGHSRVVELLVDKRLGKSFSKKSIAHPDRKVGRSTPLLVTIEEISRATTFQQPVEQYYTILQSLLKAGAKGHLSVRISEKQETNPVTLAIERRLPRVVSILVQHNVDVTKRAKGKRSPFVIACQEGCVEVVQTLYQKIKKVPHSIEENLKLNTDVRQFIESVSKKAAQIGQEARAKLPRQTIDAVSEDINEEASSSEHSETETQPQSKSNSEFPSASASPRATPTSKARYQVSAQELSRLLENLIIKEVSN